MITKFIIDGRPFWMPSAWTAVLIEGVVYERKHTSTGLPYWLART